MNKAGLSGSEAHKSRMRAGEADLSQVASHRSHSSASHDGEGTLGFLASSGTIFFSRWFLVVGP